MNACFPEVLDDIFKEIKQGSRQIEAERKIMGNITHAEIGGWICREWGISEDIVSIVEFHHTPFMARENKDEVRIVFLADLISEQYYKRLLGINDQPVFSEQVLKSFGITKNIMQEISTLLSTEIKITLNTSRCKTILSRLSLPS